MISWDPLSLPGPLTREQAQVLFLAIIKCSLAFRVAFVYCRIPGTSLPLSGFNRRKLSKQQLHTLSKLVIL